MVMVLVGSTERMCLVMVAVQGEGVAEVLLTVAEPEKVVVERLEKMVAV